MSRPTPAGRRGRSTSRPRASKQTPAGNAYRSVHASGAGGGENANATKAMNYVVTLANLSPADQALLAQPPLNTKVARKKPSTKGKRKNGALETILEYNDLGNDGYYIKPDIPSKDPHGGDAKKKK